MKRFFPILTFALLILFMPIFFGSYVYATTGKEKVIEIKAKKFSYSPNIITVNKGDLVVLKLTSEDVTHGFFLDGYGVDFFVNPGETRSTIFRANKTGRFSFRCSVTCGSFHPYMIGYLKVLPNRKFHVGLLTIFLLGIGSLIITRKKIGNPENKLFKSIPLNWKFELTNYKGVRNFLKNRWFPFVPILINIFIFTVILVAGWTGGIGAGNYNFGIMIVWILWWVLLMIIMVPFFGRIWCMVCPLPVFGEWLQRLKIIGVRRKKLFGLNKRWPNRLRNLWPTNIIFLVATFFSGFFTVMPIANFILLGIIIIGAIVISLIYEKRTFCLFFCPVSGFQGLYSNFGSVEVRVKDPDICKNHTPKTCYVGNENGYGCPWMELPYDMNRNTYCGLCMECFKSCPYDNMAFNLRTPAKDFFVERKRTDDVYNRRGLDEAFKSFIMVGAVIMFYIAMQGPWGWVKDIVRAHNFTGYLAYLPIYSLLCLAFIPGLFFIFSYLSKKMSGNKEISLKKVFVNFSYCLVPIGIARWIAFSLGVILPNGSYLLHVVSDPYAFGWNLFKTANFAWTPVLTGTMSYLQTGILILGLIFALEFGHKLSRITYSNEKEAKRGWIPILIFLIGLSVFFHWLFGG
ncbi:MAG: cupredoxin domain-containing protein [Acidobacteriota bacterium]